MIELEPGYFQVNSFDEIRTDLKNLFDRSGISTLYKLRYWREAFHPEFLTEGEIYFSKPNELNDPFDINRPLTVDIDELRSPEFYQRLVETAPTILGVKPGREAEAAAQKQLEKLLADPQGEILKNYTNLISDPHYNESIGVFSMSTKIDNEQLWGYYGGALRGYAVGFNPMALSEELFSSCSSVRYTDRIDVWRILDRSRKNMHDKWFEKNPCWNFESEFRYVRVVYEASRRTHNFKPQSVKEIVLGPRTVNEDRRAIMAVAKHRYPHAKMKEIKIDYLKGIIYSEEIEF